LYFDSFVKVLLAIGQWMNGIKLANRQNSVINTVYWWRILCTGNEHTEQIIYNVIILVSFSFQYC